MDKKALSERDIVSKFILDALARSGWDALNQVREEFPMSAGRVVVKASSRRPGPRDRAERADIVLFYRPNIPVAVIEVKRNDKTVGAGIQQALRYADRLDVPLAYSTNGDVGDRSALLAEMERRGVFLEDLTRKVGEDYATLDILAHVAFSAILLTRRERSRSARVKKLLQQQAELSRAVLEALLEKFVDEGVETIGDLELLRVRPFDKMRTLVELVRAFGGRRAYDQVLAALEGALYQDV